jgi:site-specific DNA-adenine methylase
MFLSAPFPYYGGKKTVSSLVWDKFGKVQNFVEPFFGSGAVLLNRPDYSLSFTETVNDKDCFLANFWRTTKFSKKELLEELIAPLSEVDLFAKRKWIRQEAQSLEDQLRSDATYHNPKLAADWVWGVSAWIGGDFTSGPPSKKRQSSHGRGVHAKRFRDPKKLEELLTRLEQRLRYVEILCGDWKRLVTPQMTFIRGVTGVFLDPPYVKSTRTVGLYGLDDVQVANEVFDWACENGSNPKLKIAVCGLEGDHNFPSGWECVAWSAPGRSKNSTNERIWFSPSCGHESLSGESK